MADAIAYPKVYELLGRSVTVSADGKSDTATRRWRVSFGTVPAAVPLPTAVPGLPAPGSVHPSLPRLRLRAWRTDEDAANGSVLYTAEYAAPTGADATTTEGGGEGEEPVEVKQKETARDWGHGSRNRDLVTDANTGDPVLNSNGEPFENTPNVAVETRTFHVSRKTPVFNTAAFEASGTVNKSTVTIQGLGHIPPHCGLLKVSITKLYDDIYDYEEDITVEVVSNRVKLAPDKEPEEIGHDIALLFTGYRYKAPGDRYGEHLVTATDIDEKTGEAKPAASPVLLTPTGEIYEVPAGSAAAGGYSKRIAAYEENEWNAVWFR